jgi:O-antigen ligase
MGFGPGNFYPNYQHYTLSDFETYVSDNPERSTAHDYPLLLLVEQGTIGLAVFLFLTGAIFIYGEKLYHRMTTPEDKRIVITLLLVIMMVYVNLLLSDLLESDKVGPFYFMSIALLAAWDMRSRKKVSLEAQGQ